jgi:hypothetical protein
MDNHPDNLKQFMVREAGYMRTMTKIVYHTVERQGAIDADW